MSFNKNTHRETQAKRRKQLLDEGIALCDLVKAANRGFTPEEEAKLEANLAEVEKIDAHREAAEESDALMKQLGETIMGTGAPTTGRAHLDFKSATKQITGTRGLKAMLAAGTSVADVTVDQNPIALGRPLQQVMDVIGLQITDRDYSYLQQTARTNNADVVADGDTKPTSIMTLKQVEGRLKTVAHLSEPVNKFWLEDNTALGQWVQDELIFGLAESLAEQILHGDGEGENFVGFEEVAGRSSQSWNTNLLLTTRSAINVLEIDGFVPAGFVLDPGTWMAIETLTLGDSFAYGSAGVPVERATRRLWGVPVVVSNTVTAGEGWLVAEGAASLRAAGQGTTPRISTEWAMVSDDFAKNQLRARVEGRFDLAAERPKGIVKLETVDPEAA